VGLTVLAKCSVGEDASYYVKRNELLSSSGGDGGGGYGGSSHFNQYDEIGILMILTLQTKTPDILSVYSK